MRKGSITAGLAAVTTVLLAFTDYDGDPAPTGPAVESAAVVPLDGGAIVVAGGRL